MSRHVLVETDSKICPIVVLCDDEGFSLIAAGSRFTNFGLLLSVISVQGKGVLSEKQLTIVRDLIDDMESDYKKRKAS